MEDVIVGIITTLGINGVFLILYMRALAKLEALGNRYLDFLEATIRSKELEDASKKNE